MSAKSFSLANAITAWARAARVFVIRASVMRDGSMSTWLLIDPPV
jgi:hypothetical protein